MTERKIPHSLRALRSDALLQNVHRITSITEEQKSKLLNEIYSCAYIAGAAQGSDVGNIYFEAQKSGLTEQAANALSHFFEMVADIVVTRRGNVAGIVGQIDQASTQLLDLRRYKSISDRKKTYAEAAFRLSMDSPEITSGEVLHQMQNQNFKGKI